MSNLSHLPVMVDEVVSLLNPKDKKIYLDGTFGQGGYSREILNKANCKIFAIDRDHQSKQFAEELKKKFGRRFIFNVEKLSNINLLLKKYKEDRIDGIVLDLGVSNTQLNNPLRGFSFSNDGPLDMRMDTTQKLTAEIVVNEFNEKDLSDIFYYYGDERNSRKIARSIIEFRKKKRINTTMLLSEIVKEINSGKFKHPATRVFQALRIYINEELRELEEILKLSLHILNNKSRIIVVAFHSLEDRLVKNFFKKNVSEKQINLTSSKPKFGFKIITKKPLTPSFEEIKMNPRSRSAKLRVAEKS
ncbi:MAG: 16S rRNA (cytosine(1402)-N(4))-methyltransferase [Pelagibacteraceae bacterium TMED65]|nr:ribosomal RNA small subunit methyltransferase H [Rickettsiales bacterium]OUU51046.1 MAG: 16S rRNA (cytosine(1402)-N(4))-methyltransferase [Pelagibacteraceae bacterium TMED65]|tara:strand:+ start:5271 stop:6179 length:909 start_codon:yes stop_codon:yes gene_type:complete